MRLLRTLCFAAALGLAVVPAIAQEQETALDGAPRADPDLVADTAIEDGEAFASADDAPATDIFVTGDYDFEDVLTAFDGGGFAETETFLQRIANTGDERALAVVDALEAGNLYIRRADGAVWIAEPGEERGMLNLVDPLTGDEADEAVAAADFAQVRVNNRVRRALQAARGSLTLLSDNPSVRARAADSVFRSRDASALDMVRQAIAEEENSGILKKLREAEAAIVLDQASDGEAAMIAAVEIVVGRGNRDALSLLNRTASRSEGAVRTAALAGVLTLEHRLERLGVVQNLWYGVSLGTVLLLAAAGLAITFGVMGVINMAHGELVMLGAYTTFVVQSLFVAFAPGALDYALLAAVPAAFLVSGGMGVAMERGIIRFLYGRPLETLLATWGVSLILQQTVRSIFGSSNVRVSTPSWMTGTVEVVPGLDLTLNRIAIAVFTLIVFLGMLLVIRKTSFGLRMRAVTQNRRMAGNVGIRSGWVDAMTFGLGAGVAGMAGVAISQIDNVSPNLGQSYIIDSFLVVVFGGVGSLWGAFVGALSLGVVNKFMEPMIGAVLAKILILVAVILFIQWRPRGLFALRGRAVEA